MSITGVEIASFDVVKASLGDRSGDRKILASLVGEIVWGRNGHSKGPCIYPSSPFLGYLNGMML